MPLLVAALLVLTLEGGARVALEGCTVDVPIFEASSRSPGYQLAAGKVARVWQFGRALTIQTDELAVRRTRGGGERGAALHLVGDSQVFGWGLSDHETISSRLQEELGSDFALVNHGVPGFGPREYERVLARIAPGERVMLLLTEQNDLPDAFGARLLATADCGYMTTPTSWLVAYLPCWLRDSRALQGGGALIRSWRHDQLPTPIQFDDLSPAATRVLGARLQRLVTAVRERYGTNVLVTYVPWSGRYNEQRRKTVFSPPSLPAPNFSFPDDCDIEKAFSAHPAPENLYLPGNDHLSPDGAALVARVLAGQLRRGADLAGHASSP